MAALDFPTAPVDGQVYKAPNGITYRWDATSGLWLTAGMGTNDAIIGVTPPANAMPGQLWFNVVLGTLFVFYDDGTSVQWVPASPSTTPPGIVLDFAGTTAPGGWYLCDGALRSRVDDNPLFLAIGTTFGAGDGSTTFALPDLRGRVTAMRDGGAGRLSTVADSLGAVGGLDKVGLLAAENGPHTHDVTDGQHYHGSDIGGGATFATVTSGQGSWQKITPGTGPDLYYSARTASAPSNITINSAGSGTPHQNTQPTMALNKVIKR